MRNHAACCSCFSKTTAVCRPALGLILRKSLSVREDVISRMQTNVMAAWDHSIKTIWASFQTFALLCRKDPFWLCLPFLTWVYLILKQAKSLWKCCQCHLQDHEIHLYLISSRVGSPTGCRSRTLRYDTLGMHAHLNFWMRPKVPGVSFSLSSGSVVRKQQEWLFLVVRLLV